MSDPDLDAIQGVWKQVAVSGGGDGDEFGGPGIQAIVSGNRFDVRAQDGALLLEGSFKLDSSKLPRQIDWTDDIGADAGKTLPAIYTLDADRFVFVAADPGAPRPTAFRAGPGQVMRSFVRA